MREVPEGKYIGSVVIDEKKMSPLRQCLKNKRVA
jgi:hypothetical protein